MLNGANAQRGQLNDYDAVVIGSGPNGLTAAITLAEAGCSVLLVEARESLGGGARTEPLTLPGFQHDLCSAIHPIGVLSPVFKQLRLDRRGVEWVYPPVSLAHPLPSGSVATLVLDAAETGRSLGEDKERWARLMEPFLGTPEDLFDDILRPVRIPWHPWTMLRFGWVGLPSCDFLVHRRFTGPLARALFAGCAAHSVLPLDAPGSASFGMVLALAAHAVGWPCVRGGSGAITTALTNRFRELGGHIQTGRTVTSLDELPPSPAVLMDLTPRQVLTIAGEKLPPKYRYQLAKFRYGSGVFKVDWALDGPIPWQNPNCARTATVHLGGTYESIFRSEAAVARGKIPEEPFVILAQPSLFDHTVAPPGKHTAWGYCHVPAGCPEDMTDRIERQVERFAPGFRDLILARHKKGPPEFERHNPNLVGGDIGGGSNQLPQFLFRPVPKWDPYTTANPRLFICSSSTPPGGGVHGMCGYWAALAALRRIRK